MVAVFTPNPVQWRETFDSPNGVVGRELRKRAIRLERLAKAQVGVDTGRLAQSIGWKFSAYPGGLAVQVGSDNSIALMHHQGTRPHIITPKRPGGMLRFPHRGIIVYARRVQHPGTRANRYLTDNLAAVVL